MTVLGEYPSGAMHVSPIAMPLSASDNEAVLSFFNSILRYFDYFLVTLCCKGNKNLSNKQEKIDLFSNKFYPNVYRIENQRVGK